MNITPEPKLIFPERTAQERNWSERMRERRLEQGQAMVCKLGLPISAAFPEVRTPARRES